MEEIIMKIVFLRAITTIITALLLALMFPVFMLFGLSDKVFLTASSILGLLLIWIALDILESRFKT